MIVTIVEETSILDRLQRIEEEHQRLKDALEAEKHARVFDPYDPVKDLLKRYSFFQGLEEKVGIVVQRMSIPELLDTLKRKNGGNIVSLMWREKILEHLLAHAYLYPGEGTRRPRGAGSP